MNLECIKRQLNQFINRLTVAAISQLSQVAVPSWSLYQEANQ